MQIKCGTDIIEIERIKNDIENLKEKFLNRIYTKKEIEYCESKGAQKYQSYAARFTAKEAIFKAISDNLENKYSIEWKDLEIINENNGKPKVKIHNHENLNMFSIDISLSHCKTYATATCIIFINIK